MRPDVRPPESPWLTVDEAAAYARCRGRKALYRAVNKGKLRAAKANDRGDLRFKVEWIDEWLEQSMPMARG